MKKLLLLICLLASAASVFAESTISRNSTEQINGICYAMVSGKVYVIDGAATNKYSAITYSGDIVIPNEVSFQDATYKVVGIDDCAFMYCTGVTSISIGENVTAIGDSAFCGCTALTSAKLPTKLKTIGKSAFQNCLVLQTAPLNSGLTTIGKNAFYNCKSLESITLPSTLTSLGEAAFEGCYLPTTITIPSSLTAVPDYAFYDCEGLQTIFMPASITSLGTYAFYGCPQITDIYDYASTPQTYDSKRWPFNETYLKVNILKNFNLHVPATSVEAYKADPVFGQMTVAGMKFEYEGLYYNMTSASTAELTCYDESPYSGDKTIASQVTFNGFTLKVNRIAAGAFSGCTDLTSVTIPSSVTSIGDGAFSGCTSLTTINDERENPQSLGSNVFDGIEDLSAIIVNLPSETISLNYSSANTWKDMMILPRLFDVDGITYLTTDGETAQATTSSQNIYGLEAAYIPESVTVVGHTLSVNGITNGAFALAPKLQTVSIPKTVTSIGTNAFLLCSSLKTIYNYATTPQTITDDLGLSTPSAISLIINPEYYDAYHAADGWKSMQIANVLVEDKVTPYTSEQTIDRIDVGYRRTFNNTQWQALYIPFDMNYEDWADDFDVAAITEFTMDSDGFHLRVDKVYTNTEANNFYFIKAHNTGTQTIIAHGTTLYPAEINKDEYVFNSWFHLTFTGNYTVNTDLDEWDYAMAGGQLCNNTEDKAATLYPYRWYLHSQFGSSSSAKDFKITISEGDDEETTSIENLNTVSAPNGKHIENRRIVISKDGKKYNVAGQQIR